MRSLGLLCGACRLGREGAARPPTGQTPAGAGQSHAIADQVAGGAFDDAGAVILLGGRTGGAEPWLVLVQGFLVASVPLFEVAFLVVVRRRKGIAWWRGSPDHFSLRLQKAGLSPLQTDLVSVAVCLAAGTLGLILGRISGAGCGVVVLAAGLLFASIWVALLRYEVEPEEAG